MDIGTAFTFVFDDEDWIKKIAIGGVAWILFIIILPIFLVLGYMLQTIRNVSDGLEQPLPEWENLGNMLIKGLMVFVIGLIYNIPIILVVCALGGVIAVAGSDLNGDVGGTLELLISCLNCLIFVFSFVINAILPAGLIWYAREDTLSAAFQFGEIFRFIVNNIGDYIIAILLGWVAQFIAIFGLLLCFIGVYFTSFWSMLVGAHLYGQLAKKANNTELSV